jgi:uracil-DNA glycosylase family 4
VFSEHPEKPLWVLIGEGPGRTEVQVQRPFQGSQQIVEKMLTKIGRRRDELALTTAVLCGAPVGTVPEALRDKAVAACSGRLQAELAQWPGIPVLTMGAVAARAVIPKATLDAIDPPDVPKTKKKSQKEKQKAEAKLLVKTAKKEARDIAKIAAARLKHKVAVRKKQLYDEAMRPLPSEPFRRRKKPSRDLVERWLASDTPKMKARADAEAIQEYELGFKERELAAQYEIAHPKPKKPAKSKPIKITDIVSTCFDVDIDGSGPRPVIPTIHPVTLLKGGGATIGGTHTPDLAFINLYYDAGKVDALARGVDIRLKLNVETEIASIDRTVQLLREIVFTAIEEGEAAIDLETYVEDPERHHALMAYMAKIRTIGIATEHRSISLMWDLIPGWAQSYVQMLLGHHKVIKTFHNGLYDRTVFLANGFNLEGPWEDTLLAHHAAFPGCAHKLQVVTSQFFAVSPWKSEFRNAEETPEGLTTYNAKDTGATRALRPALTVWVKRTGTEKIYALDRKMSEIASKMHLAGMPVDRGVNTELLNTFSKNVKESRQAVDDVAADPKIREQMFHHLALQQAQKARKNDPSEYVTPEGVTVRELEARYYRRLDEIKYNSKWKWKVGSGKHIAALLLALGVGLHQTTASGQISTKKDILETLTNVPVVRDILTFRENDKLLSTFIWQIFDRFDRDGNLIQYGYADGDDRIHPIWVVHKITGRWASSEPVVSNVPKDKYRKLADGTKQIVRPNLRRQIVAPPGRIFVGFDFAQLEARIIALISGDPFLCDVFARGMDIHRECARVVFPQFDTLPKDDQKQARDLVKPLEYGAFYGGAVETLWKDLLKEGRQISLANVAKAVATLMAKMAGVVRWQQETVRKASLPPFMIKEFLYGRCRTFPLGQVEATEAMNFGVQAAGASIMNTGMAIADDGLSAYKEAFAIAQIHDAAVFECWEDDAPRLAEDVDRWFTQSYESGGRSIPFTVDVKIAKSWADV